MMDDTMLVNQVRNGNTHAYRILVDKYKDLVWHMVLRMVRQQEEAEDVCQEVFLRVFRDIGKFRHESKLSTWIASIAYHLSIDHIRKTKREVITAMEEYTPAMLRHVDVPPLIGSMDRLELRNLLHRIIDAMPLHYRTVVTLFHLEGIPYTEISRITGMPEGTIKSYLNRGRQIIREKMTERLPDIKHILFEQELS